MCRLQAAVIKRVLSSKCPIIHEVPTDDDAASWPACTADGSTCIQVGRDGKRFIRLPGLPGLTSSAVLSHNATAASSVAEAKMSVPAIIRDTAGGYDWKQNLSPDGSTLAAWPQPKPSSPQADRAPCGHDLSQAEQASLYFFCAKSGHLLFRQPLQQIGRAHV